MSFGTYLFVTCSMLITVVYSWKASFCIFKGILVGPGLGWMGDAHIDFEKKHTYLHILLMEEILHQLIGSLSHYLQGFIHVRWCRILSINSITMVFVYTDHPPHHFLLMRRSSSVPSVAPSTRAGFVLCSCCRTDNGGVGETCWVIATRRSYQRLGTWWWYRWWKKSCTTWDL